MTRGEWIVSAIACIALAGLIGDGIGYKRGRTERVENLKPLVVVQQGSEPWYARAPRNCKEQYFVCQKQKAMEQVQKERGS